MLTKSRGAIYALVLVFVSLGYFTIVKSGVFSNDVEDQGADVHEGKPESRKTEVSQRSGSGDFRSITSIKSLSDAILAIQEEHGFEVNGQNAVIRLFSQCDLDLEALFGFIDGLSNNEVKDAALAGMLLRFSVIGDGELAGHFDLNKILRTKSGRTALETGFGAFVEAVAPDQRERRMREVLILLGGHYGDRFSRDQLGAVIAASVAQPGMSVEFLNVVRSEGPGLFANEKFAKELMKTWGKDDTLAALSHAVSLDLLSPVVLYTFATKAFEYDQDRTERIRALLPEDSIEAFAVARARWEIDQGLLEDARATLATIKHKVLKKRFGGAFWNVESKLVSEASKQNPKKLVMEFANGTSKFAVHKMPIALRAWIEKDYEEAAQWASNELRNLRPEAREFVAMTYAQEAAKRGHQKIALEWAALIIDKERKAKVMKNIAKGRKD